MYTMTSHEAIARGDHAPVPVAANDPAPRPDAPPTLPRAGLWVPFAAPAVVLVWAALRQLARAMRRAPLWHVVSHADVLDTWVVLGTTRILVAARVRGHLDAAGETATINDPAMVAVLAALAPERVATATLEGLASAVRAAHAAGYGWLAVRGATLEEVAVPLVELAPVLGALEALGGCDRDGGRAWVYTTELAGETVLAIDTGPAVAWIDAGRISARAYPHELGDVTSTTPTGGATIDESDVVFRAEPLAAQVKVIVPRDAWPMVADALRSAVGLLARWAVRRTACDAVVSREQLADVREVLRVAGAHAIEAEVDVRQCDACGCVEELACDGGCSWTGASRCSACAPRGGDPRKGDLSRAHRHGRRR